jgi:hypothetical protein
MSDYERGHRFWNIYVKKFQVTKEIFSAQLQSQNTYLKGFSLELNIFFWKSIKLMSSSIIRHLKCRVPVCVWCCLLQM